MYQESIQAVTSLPGIPFEKLAGKNILVTGATGLIGSSIIDVLMERAQNGFHVYAAGRNLARARSRFSSYFGKDSFHFLQFDVLKSLDCDIEFHYIIHAASEASPGAFVSSPVEVMKANICGLCNLLDYGRKHGLIRLLYVSSGEVYGQGDGSVFHESDSGYVNPALSRSCYPSSKRAAETLCASYADEYGLDIVIARPCHIYGPFFTEKDNRAFAQFLRNAINKENIVLKSSGAQYRSWCYVVDCVSALFYILLKGDSGQAYNVAESDYSIKDFASTVARLCNQSVVFDTPSCHEQKGFNKVSESVLSTEKLRELGWEPHFDLVSGISECLSTLKAALR